MQKLSSLAQTPHIFLYLKSQRKIIFNKIFSFQTLNPPPHNKPQTPYKLIRKIKLKTTKFIYSLEGFEKVRQLPTYIKMGAAYSFQQWEPSIAPSENLISILIYMERHKAQALEVHT